MVVLAVVNFISFCVCMCAIVVCLLLFQGIDEKQPFWLMLFSLFKYNFLKNK